MDFLRKNRITILIIGVALVSLARMFVLLLGTDPINGYSQSLLWSIVQIAVCALVLAVTVAPAVYPKQELKLGDSVLFRIMAGIAALGYAVKLAMSLVGLWREFSLNMMMYEIRLPWLALVKVLLAVLAVGFFFLLCRAGTRLPSTMSLILILGPIGLYVVRLIESFMTITMNPSVDTYSILLLGCCAGLMFLSYLGRCLLDMKVKSAFAAWTAVAAVVLALSSVANLLFTVVKAPAYLGLIAIEDLICDFCLMLVAVAGTNIHQGVPLGVRRHAMVGSAVPLPRHRGRYIPKH